MTKTDLEKIMRQHQQLAAHGFYAVGHVNQDGRDRLRSCTNVCNRAIKLFELFRTTDHINPEHTSNDLRVLLEVRDRAPAFAGAIIAAAYHVGLQVEQAGAIARFNLHADDINAMRRELLN